MNKTVLLSLGLILLPACGCNKKEATVVTTTHTTTETSTKASVPSASKEMTDDLDDLFDLDGREEVIK